jgi:RNA polymerase sigma-70 factor (ECF subfamily)
MVTDAYLIEKTLKGEAQAFGQLVTKYQKEIYSVVKVFVHNPDDADDLTQDVFIQAYKKLPQLKEKDKFLPWVKQIARNQAKRWLQRPRLDLLPLEEAQKELTSLTPDEQLLRKELMEAIMQAIDSLPEQDKQVVHAYLDGMSHAQIAKESGISYQASMKRLHRARKKIRERIKKLMHAIILLPKMYSPIKKIISGGIMAMKITTSAKVTIGFLCVLVAGFIGFQIVTRQPDVKAPKVVTQRQITRSEVKQRPVSKIGSRPSKNELSKSEIEGTVEGLDSKEGVAPAEKVTEEGKMEEQEILQAAPQEATVSEADLINEFNQIKARIMAGERFNDCSTPIRALLTRISAWHHKDEEAFRTVEARSDGKGLLDLLDELSRKGFTREGFARQLASVRVVEVPIPKPNPSNGDVHPIFTIEREGEPNTPEGELGVYTFFYYDGRWRALCNGYDLDNWRPPIVDEWLREKLEFLQSQ